LKRPGLAPESTNSKLAEDSAEEEEKRAETRRYGMNRRVGLVSSCWR
jgi:hypothetical protein